VVKQLKIKSEDKGTYTINQTEDDIIKSALEILKKRVFTDKALTSPKDTRDFIILHLAGLEHEVFGCLWMNNRHVIISCDNLFRGTVDGASVYPREVVKEALKKNSAAVIFFHNHPSGIAEPSSADINLTRRLKTALELVDVRVLDHFVISGGEAVSFAERGLL